jgi:1-acyl-sn-glycerol-3-phosphate acyltransferase
MWANFIYKSVRLYVTVALRFFFRKWQITGKENIPENAAVIYVVNHQNAFLDAILIACATKDEPWFLTRAGVFANAIARTMLRLFHMMPVYRFRDGFKSLKNNDTTIRQCVDLLNERKSILLFVEGDQSLQWRLRALQKGFARIAYAALQENNWNLPLYIVPVGVQYDHHYYFRSRVLINYGPAFPIDLTYQTLPEREFNDMLVEKVQKSLLPLMLHIEPEHYDELENYLRANRNKKDLVEQLKQDQQIIENWERHPKSLPHPKGINYFLLISTLPLHIYCWVNNALPYFVLKKILDKYVTIEFMGSLKLAFGMVIVPFFYLLQAGVLHIIFKDWYITALYALTLPFISVWSVDLFKRATGYHL